jgi:signal peptidase II
MRALRPAVVLGLIALDRATKLWAMNSLRSDGSIPVFPGFELAYVENTGAAFNLGYGANTLFVFVSLGLIVYLIRLMSRWPKTDPWLQYGGALVLAGALGNLYDRVAYRHVVDFLYVHHWPVFNVADSCITVGACLLAWGLKDEKTSAPA